MSKQVTVIVKKRGRIPGMGRGPFLVPRPISEDLYNNLKKLGYPVEIVNKDPKVNLAVPNIVIETQKVEEKIPEVKATLDDESSLKETEDVEESTPDNEEDKEIAFVTGLSIIEDTTDNVEAESVTTVAEIITEEELESDEEVIEIIVNDPDLSADALYTEDFLSSKNMCKKILSAREVQYEENASFAMLKTLVLESNPVVEED